MFKDFLANFITVSVFVFFVTIAVATILFTVESFIRGHGWFGLLGSALIVSYIALAITLAERA